MWYFQQCACVNAIYFAPVVTTAYRMKNKRGQQGVWSLKCVSLLERVGNCKICSTVVHTWAYHMEKISRRLFYIYRNWYYLWVELSGWMGSVSYGLGADLSLPPCLSVTMGIWTLAHKSDLRAEISGSIVRYDAMEPCCLGVLFAHTQVPSKYKSYHIRGNEMNCLGSSEYITVFTSFTRASIVNMRADQNDVGWSERLPSQNRPFCNYFAVL